METTLTLSPIRWQETPSRVTILRNGTGLRTYLQTTSFEDLPALCWGRPAEEVLRIVSILSPAHHLAAAKALDRLFRVEPPETALNMRAGLMQALYACHHLRKLHLLLNGFTDLFASPRAADRAGKGEILQTAADLMAALHLAQEAATILGGRADHPISSLPGGVSRFLKPEYYERLDEIAVQFKPAVDKIGKIFSEKILAEDGPLGKMDGIAAEAIGAASLSDKEAEEKIRFKNGSGADRDSLSPEAALDGIECYTEPWTRTPFAGYEKAGGSYCVGPLARSAEEGEKPSAMAAFRAMLKELSKTAAAMQELYIQEKITGPSVRTVPKDIGTEGAAAVEAPEGLILHRYRVDEKGIVREMKILDPRVQNNALRCDLAKNAVDRGLSRGKSPKEIKGLVEMALLPF